MDKLKIFHIAGISGRGGTGASALKMAVKLHEKGHNITFACFPKSVLRHQLEKSGISVITDIKMQGKFKFKKKYFQSFFKDIKKLKKIVEEQQIDILHLHASPEYSIACIASLFFKRKPVLVRSRHIPIPIRSNFFNKYFFNRLTDKVVTSAEVIKNNYFNSGAFNSNKITTIYDGVDTKNFNITTDKNHIRKRYNIPEDLPVVISIARYNPVKGHKYLINALANIKHSGTHFKCLMVGYEDNSYRGEKQKFEELCSELNLQGDIIFIDSKINVSELLSIANLFVLSSVGSEGSSRATLEAMVMAKPVIATKVGILPEIVIDNTTGYLIAPRDVDGLTQAMNSLLNNPLKAAEMGLKGKRIIEENFNLDKSINELENLYHKLLVESQKRKSK